jgi:ABC-type multidrug transport system ATPase subunit
VLQLHQRLAGSAGGERERSELLELVGLADARDTQVESMSKECSSASRIAQALVGSPRLLLLDEPTRARSTRRAAGPSGRCSSSFAAAA